MSKRRVILLAALWLVSVLMLSSCGVNEGRLPGEIIMECSDSGVMAYVPSTGLKRTLLHGRFYGLEMNSAGTKIMFAKTYSGVGPPEFESEYDFTTGEVRNVEEFNEERATETNYVKYVPNSDNISYRNRHKELVVLDRQTDQETVIAKGIHGYSWNKDGTRVLLDDYDDNIFELDLKTGEKKRLFDGMEPVYSNSNGYIAYRNQDGDLVVHEVSSGKEWKRSAGRADNVTFSPDDNYLVYSDFYDVGLAGRSFYYKVYVYDFKNDCESTLLKGKGQVTGLAWR